MVIERRWKRWVFFRIPLAAFVVGTLFPFYWMLVTAVRPDHELYRSWRAVNNAPFWTLQPTLAHFQDLLARTTFLHWLWNTFFIACASTGISLFCGLLAGYALARLRFPMAGPLGTGIFVTYLVPPTLLFIPLADIIRNFQLIYVLTGGGPANSTHLLATYAYQLGVATGLLGEGAAVSLFMFPVLFAVVCVQLWYVRRMEGA